MYSLTLYTKTTELWKYESNDLEEIAGMACISLAILKELNKDNYTPVSVKSNTSLKQFRVINNHPSELLEQYDCKDKDSEEFEICNTIFTAVGNNVGIWVNSGSNREIGYSLYVFKTMSFINGMIKFSELFNEDFRSYVYDTPFLADSTEYKIENYEFKKRVHRVIPIDTEVEEDEAGDDNIQNPYADYDPIFDDDINDNIMTTI